MTNVERVEHDDGTVMERVCHDDGRVVEREYYKDGTLRAEVTLVNGSPHGVTREWHPNGVLASEIPLTHGVIDGTVSYWNENGELIGACTLLRGTGVHKSWYPSGALMGEMDMIDGHMTGRHRVYWEDGEVVADIYYIKNRKVSRKRYREACLQNPSWPKYEDDAGAPRTGLRQPKQSAPPPSMPPDDGLAISLLQGPCVREARSWLTETAEPERSLGEATTREDSLDFVERLYRAGAVAVHAVDIDGGPDEQQNSGRLVIELPNDAKCRRKLLRICARIAEELGFEGEPDEGQRYVLLMLD